MKIRNGFSVFTKLETGLRQGKFRFEVYPWLFGLCKNLEANRFAEKLCPTTFAVPLALSTG